MYRMIVLLCLICMAVPTITLPQQEQPGKSADLKQQFQEAFCQIRSNELKDCQDHLQQWQTRWDQIVYKNEALSAEKEELRNEIADLKNDDHSSVSFTQYLGLGFGLGIGAGVVVVLVLFWRRLKPTSPKKQLAVLVFCSAWIVVTGMVMEADSTLNKHPINLLVSIFVYSLPALLFTAVSLWWLKRTSADVVKLW